MRKILVVLIGLAVLGAGGTALLVKRFLDAQKQTQAQAEDKPKVSQKLVVVADRDLPAGTVLNRGENAGAIIPH